MSDDLFTASVSQRPPVTEQPFRLGSMFLPAFFGGPLAFLHFASRSARRLHEPLERRRLLTATAVGVLLLALVAAVLAERYGATGRELRLIVQLAGVVTLLLCTPVLRPGQRRYELRGGDYEPVGFLRGLGVCVAYGLVQGLLVVTAVGVFA